MGEPVRFGLVGPSYALANLSIDNQACINLFASVDESGAGNSPIGLDPTPGTKLFVDLARAVSPAVPGVGAFDQNDGGAFDNNVIPVVGPTISPAEASEWAISVINGLISGSTETFTPSGSGTWTGFGGVALEQITSGPINLAGSFGLACYWAECLALLKLIGTASLPVTVQAPLAGTAGVPISAGPFVSPITAGNMLLCVLQGTTHDNFPGNFTVSDGVNTWVRLASSSNFNEGGTTAGPLVEIWAAFNVAAGSPTFTITGPITSGAGYSIGEYPGGVAAVTNSGPTRGSLEISGRAFEVCGQDFDELMPNGTFTTWGQVANDSLSVTMAASPQQLLLASAGSAYVFDLTSNTLTQIPGVTFDGPVAQAGICADFFLLTIQDSKEFYVSAPLDATDWVTNGSAIISFYPDNTVSMFVFQSQIWFFSDTQIAVYFASGNIFPFDVNLNANIQSGSAAQNGVAQMNNIIYWLEVNAQGHGKVQSAQGYAPQRISNHALEFAIQGYARIDDAVAWTAQFEGHDFYNIYFPTPSVTWVYDAATGMWHQEAFEVALTGQFQAAHRWNHMFVFGKHLVGDWQSGKVYEMQIPTLNGSTWNFGDDDGAPIVRIRRAPHISKTQRRQFFNELQLFVQPGLGSVPIPSSSPTFVVLAESGNPSNSWLVSIADDGTITRTLTSLPAQDLFLNNLGVSRQVFVTAGGASFTLTVVTFNPLYSTSFPMATTGTFLQSGLTLT